MAFDEQFKATVSNAGGSSLFSFWGRAGIQGFLWYGLSFDVCLQTLAGCFERP